jgi:hypothetical protein
MAFNGGYQWRLSVKMKVSLSEAYQDFLKISDLREALPVKIFNWKFILSQKASLSLICVLILFLLKALKMYF